MAALWQMSATALLAGYASGRLSPVDAMEAVLARIDAVNPALNAFFVVSADEAIQAARDSEARWRVGAPMGVLDGVPVSIKDSIAMAGWPYWRGTKGRVGTTSSLDSPPVARLKEAGAILFGKTTMPDYGLLASGVSSAHGTTRNPWNISMNTGGSSSGAGAAVASGMGPASIGSDLAGSVRLPASHCGIFALKPSQGAVPHTPHSSARVAGPMSRTVADAALLLSVLSRPDAETAASGGALPASVATAEVRGLRIGLLIGKGFGDEVDPAVSELVSRAAGLFGLAGALVHEMRDPIRPELLDDIRSVFTVKAAMEREELPPDARSLTLDTITRFCDEGDGVSAKRYLQAVEGIERAKAGFREASSGFDFILSPVMPVVGFPAEAVGPEEDMPMRHLSFTAITNQLGWPAASICCGFTADGLPVGLQIAGVMGRDADILALAAWYEQARGFDPGFPVI